MLCGAVLSVAALWLTHVRVLFARLRRIERSASAILLGQPETMKSQGILLFGIAVEIVGVYGNTAGIPYSEIILEHQVGYAT